MSREADRIIKGDRSIQYDWTSSELLEGIDRSSSEIIEQDFNQYLKYFETRFNKHNACIENLWQWRGWVKKKGNQVKWNRCPFKGCNSTRARLHRKNKPNPLAETYRCINTKPKRHEFSIITKTIFKKTRSPLWFWYLTIYSMVLLDGKVPKTFLIKKCNQYAKKNGLTIKELDNNLDRIAKKIRKAVFRKKNNKPKPKYLELIGLKPKKNYLEWYKSKDRQEWKFGWRKGKHSKDNEIAQKVALDNELSEIDSVFYLKSYHRVNRNDWVLYFKVKKGKISFIRWIYVDRIKELKGSKKYSYQIIQLHNKQNAWRRPFAITKKFKNAFSKAILEYGRENIQKKIVSDNIVAPPEELLVRIARIMAKAV